MSDLDWWCGSSRGLWRTKFLTSLPPFSRKLSSSTQWYLGVLGQEKGKRFGSRLAQYSVWRPRPSVAAITSSPLLWGERSHSVTRYIKGDSDGWCLKAQFWAQQQLQCYGQMEERFWWISSSHHHHSNLPYKGFFSHLKLKSEFPSVPKLLQAL